MLSDSLKKYREEASMIMLKAHVHGPQIENVRNASTRAELLLALNGAKESLKNTKFYHELDNLIAFVKADLSR